MQQYPPGAYIRTFLLQVMDVDLANEIHRPSFSDMLILTANVLVSTAQVP